MREGKRFAGVQGQLAVTFTWFLIGLSVNKWFSGFTNSRQFLELAPVSQSVLGRPQQNFRWVAIGIKVLGKTAFRSGEVYEGKRFTCSGIDEPVLFLGGVTGQIQAFQDRVTLAGVMDEYGKGTTVTCQSGLCSCSVISNEVFWLASGIADNH